MDSNPPALGKKRTIRVRKEDSALLYCILESYEGLTSYSTLDQPAGAGYRDIELSYSEESQLELDRLLASLGEMIYELNAL